MSALIVWIGQNQARLFHLKPERIHVESVHFDVDGREYGAKAQLFFQAISERLQQSIAKKLIVMGAGPEPYQFKNYIDQCCPDLNRRIIKIESVEQLPDADILTAGRKILHEHYLVGN